MDAKAAGKKCCLALMSFAVVMAAVLYVWLPQGQALAVTITQRDLWSPGSAHGTAWGGKPVPQRGPDVIYGKVSDRSGAMTNGVVDLDCLGASTEVGFGSDGVFRTVLPPQRGRCEFAVRADYGGKWYSAHGTFELRPGHAYYIYATLKPTGLLVAFPVESY